MQYLPGGPGVSLLQAVSPLTSIWKPLAASCLSYIRRKAEELQDLQLGPQESSF